jgi:hypothetical protein
LPEHAIWRQLHRSVLDYQQQQARQDQAADAADQGSRHDAPRLEWTTHLASAGWSHCFITT